MQIIFAKHLSVRHLILLRTWIAFVCMYVCMYVCQSLVCHTNCCMGDEHFRVAVSISDCACLLHAEVRLSLYYKYFRQYVLSQQSHWRTPHSLIQCNLDYPDLVYPELRLSGLAGDQKYITMHAQKAWPMIICGCGHRLSDELQTLQACLGQN